MYWIEVLLDHWPYATPALPLVPVLLALLLTRRAAASASPEPTPEPPPELPTPEPPPEPVSAPEPEPAHEPAALILPLPGVAAAQKEREEQLQLQSRMAAAVAGRDTVLRIAERVNPYYAPGTDEQPIGSHAGGCGNLERYTRGKVAPSQSTFGGRLQGCADVKLVMVYRWLCQNLSEGERQDLYAAGGMKACDDACVAMAEHLLGYDRPWWKKLLGIGMPSRATLPEGLRRLV